MPSNARELTFKEYNKKFTRTSTLTAFLHFLHTRPHGHSTNSSPYIFSIALFREKYSSVRPSTWISQHRVSRRIGSTFRHIQRIAFFDFARMSGNHLMEVVALSIKCGLHALQASLFLHSLLSCMPYTFGPVKLGSFLGSARISTEALDVPSVAMIDSVANYYEQH
jgi:hypothetical protein